jgi:DNA-directed RNA polymerase subunit RPC12/RpoP
MSLLNINIITMKLVCPECKNEVDLTPYQNLAKDTVVECNVCGISLLVTNIEGENVETEIVDEGK